MHPIQVIQFKIKVTSKLLITFKKSEAIIITKP
jgi:hypothetical protein